MKTNVSIELDERDLDLFADILDGKQTKRTATRKEITAFVKGCVASMVAQGNTALIPLHQRDIIDVGATTLPSSAVPDAEDIELLRGRAPSYVMGWNKVKQAR